MVLQRKQTPQSGMPDSALSLQSSDGIQLIVFPPAVVEGFRRMVTSLTCQSPLPSRIALVATLREEGVTYSTLALATVLANDLGARVCAVELNWWSPGMQALLAGQPAIAPRRGWRRPGAPVPARSPVLPDSPGLAGVLADTATIDEALIATGLPHLALLPAGDLRAAQRPAMARSATLKACLDRLAQRFDYLLLDIPALAATSDAMALASLGAACCVIIRQGVTPMSQVQRALNDVKHLSMLGIVMNRIHIKSPHWIQAVLPQE